MAIPEDFAERIMFRANMLRNLREAKAPECISKPLEEMFKESLNPIVFILTMAATLLKEREINQEKNSIPCGSCKNHIFEINEDTMMPDKDECGKKHDISEKAWDELSKGCVDFEVGGIFPLNYTEVRFRDIEKKYSPKGILDLIHIVGEELVNWKL